MDSQQNRILFLTFSVEICHFRLLFRLVAFIDTIERNGLGRILVPFSLSDQCDHIGQFLIFQGDNKIHKCSRFDCQLFGLF